MVTFIDGKRPVGKLAYYCNDEVTYYTNEQAMIDDFRESLELGDLDDIIICVAPGMDSLRNWILRVAYDVADRYPEEIYELVD